MTGFSFVTLRRLYFVYFGERPQGARMNIIFKCYNIIIIVKKQIKFIQFYAKLYERIDVANGEGDDRIFQNGMTENERIDGVGKPKRI
jgi:hypothetical protein